MAYPSILRIACPSTLHICVVTSLLGLYSGPHKVHSIAQYKYSDCNKLCLVSIHQPVVILLDVFTSRKKETLPSIVADASGTEIATVSWVIPALPTTVIDVSV